MHPHDDRQGGECVGRKFRKLLGLITGVALLNIVVFSPGLIGLSFGASALAAATAATVVVVSLFTVFYGSYSLLFTVPKLRPVKEIDTHEDYVRSLTYYRHIKPLHKDISLALDQLQRLHKKSPALTAVLRNRFEPTEMSYVKFATVVEEVRTLFYQNVRGMLNKLSVFDPNDFRMLASRRTTQHFSQKLMEDKVMLYNEYMKIMSGYLSANEEILLKLDKLMLEISRLGSVNYQEIEELPCIKEIDTLIQQTKYYKQQ